MTPTSHIKAIREALANIKNITKSQPVDYYKDHDMAIQLINICIGLAVKAESALEALQQDGWRPSEESIADAWDYFEYGSGHDREAFEKALTLLDTAAPGEPSSRTVIKDEIIANNAEILPSGNPTPEPLGCRKAFEAWAYQYNHDLTPLGENYANPGTHNMWAIWRAAWNIATVSRKEGV